MLFVRLMFSIYSALFIGYTDTKIYKQQGDVNCHRYKEVSINRAGADS